MMRQQLVTFFFLFVVTFGLAQQTDLYSYKNSMLFAKYLEKTGQYELAIEEMERLLFITPKDDSLKLSLVKVYRQSENYNLGLGKTETYFPKTASMPRPFAKEYSKMLLLNNELNRTTQFTNSQKNFTNEDKFYITLNSNLFELEWKKADSTFSNTDSTITSKYPKYEALIDKAIHLKYKKAGVAMMMSTVIPGAGKAYTKDWADAILSFVTVGAFAYQAYRGFSRNGTSSAIGWVFGSIGFGFYMGNVYGSYRGAKIYNQKLNYKIYDEANLLFNTDY